MASLAARRPHNVAGPLYVDETCIDCDTCRWMAPTVFARRGGKSAVIKQPAAASTPNEAERLAALRALVSCPTASIGTTDLAGLPQVVQSFPIPVAGAVHHCGYHSPASYGAASYFITRTDAQGNPENVLIDSPRFASPLVRRLEELGGVQWMLLTHRDDVADHERFARHFGCRRVLHELDQPGIGPVELVLKGDKPSTIVPGLTAIPTPGHTAGHTCYLWEDPGAGESFLFTGDHLAGDGQGGLEAWPDVCWHDWEQQKHSLRLLRDFTFQHVMPGHGSPLHAPPATMSALLAQCIERMEHS